MRKVVRRLFVDYEKEENWLNDMAAKGLAFVDYSFGRYVFTDCEPGEYIYRLELLENTIDNPESKKYLDFMAETGAEPVATWIRWVYFRKKASDGPFELFSDAANKIVHYKRILWLYFVIMCAVILTGIMNVIIGVQRFYDPSYTGVSPNFVIGIVGICVGIALFFPYNHTRLKVKSLRQDKIVME